MRLLSKDLKRLLYNALLFSNKKASAVGDICLVGTVGTLVATATDDHVAFQDYITSPFTEEAGGFVRYLPYDEARLIEKGLLDDNTAVEVTVLTGNEPDSVDQEFWGMVSEYLSLKDFHDTGDVGVMFALNPNRMRKFSLIKTPGKNEYPIDFLYGAIGDRDVLAFKCGPTAHGILAPLLRSVVADTLDDAEDAMW